MELYKWSKTAANNNSAVPDGAPEGWVGANVNNWGREQMASIRTHIEDAAYFDPNYQLTAVGVKSLTRVSATQFTILACDATAYFTADRRIRVVGATTDQGFVTSSSFAVDTTVNVTMDSADVPTAPTQALVLVDAKIRGLAYKKPGSGNGADADTLDTYHAADLYGTALFAEALVNGSMLVWQRGTGSTSCPAGTRTLLADRWFTNPAGAAATAIRTTTVPTGAISPYALLVTGAASVTATTVAGQRVESYLMPYVKSGSVTISALVKNDTTAALVLSLLLGTPNAVDDFTTVVNRLTQALTSIPSGNSQRVSFTVDVSGYTNINNGLQVEFQAPNGALDSGAKSITITEIQVDRATLFTFFRFRTLPDELVRCRRYYQKTFPYATAPAQNAGVSPVGSAPPNGTNLEISTFDRKTSCDAIKASQTTRCKQC